MSKERDIRQEFEGEQLEACSSDAATARSARRSS